MSISTTRLTNDTPYKLSKGGTSENFLIQFLNNSSEMNSIENRVDQHFWFIHGSKNSSNELEQLFSKFIQSNFAILSSSQTTEREKAEDVFNAYREAYFTTLKEDKAFQDAFEKQKQAFSILFSDEKIENAIQSIVLARVKTLHSIVPGLILEKIFSLPPYSLRLHAVSTYSSSIQMNVSDLLTFYQKQFVKF